MLTGNDAAVIKKIVGDAVGSVKIGVSTLKQDISTLKGEMSGLKQDVSALKQDVSGLKQDVSGLKAGQARLERGMKGLERGLKREHKIGGAILNYLEREDKQIKDRVGRIEFHLGIAPN